MKSKHTLLLYYLYTLILCTTASADSKNGILVWFYSMATKKNLEYGSISKFTQSAGVTYTQIIP